MHPRQFARNAPDSPALSMLDAEGRITQTLSYEQLDRRANRYAHAFRALGLQRGDVVAVWKRNSLSYLPIFWAAQRSGVLICPVAVHLSPEETDYIIRDSGAKLLITDGRVGQAADLVAQYRAEGVLDEHIFSADFPLDPLPDFDAFAADFPETPIPDESAGHYMLYSSGTTGRPKGIKVSLPDTAVEVDMPVITLMGQLYGISPETRYLSPAPLYHAAPLVYCSIVHRLGGHVLVMDKFREESFLKAVQTNAITFTQMVPTMFVRLLKLPEKVRAQYDMSSLENVLHAAAPCPIHVKHQMIDWLGPIINEYYAGSEGNGMTYIGAADWLNRPGTVGRAISGILHICDEETGEPLPAGKSGTVYFESDQVFEYHGDPEKTKRGRHPTRPSLTTLGDIGHVDEDGFLFLTDRKANMIISGGVNIYPQETENVLLQHPKVLDAAVLGVPCEDMGERVKAFIQLVDGAEADGLEGELIEFTRARISAVKAPREVEVIAALPRTESGKLLKRRLLNS